MNYIDIETFLAIAETKSLSNAAEKLFLSQSTISYRLNSLEQELGNKLVLREKGKSTINLTVKGDEFVSIAQMWRALLQSTNEWKIQQPSYKLKIGSVDTINTCVFPELYKQILYDQLPLILDVGTHWTINIHRFVESYELDVGFVLWEIPSKNIVSKPLFIEPMVMISSPKVSFKNLVHPKDLDSKKEIYFYCGPNFRHWHDSWWPNAEKENLKVDTVSLLKIFMESNDYWSIVPLSVAKTLKKVLQIKISELVSPPPDRVCYQIVNKNQLPRAEKPLEAFNKRLENFLKSEYFLKLIK